MLSTSFKVLPQTAAEMLQHDPQKLSPCSHYKQCIPHLIEQSEKSETCTVFFLLNIQTYVVF